MIESMAEDDLRSHAPVLLRDGRTFFTEENIEEAYPGSKRADVIIDLGEGIGVFEIVSGRLSVPTRINGDRASFESDMERILYKKIRQLHETIESFLSNPSALIPSVAVTRPIQPVVVAGETFPVSPITCRCAHEYCLANSLLGQDGVRPLAIVDIGDLESLEGLSSEGHSMLAILQGWKRSDLAEVSLRNFLLENYPWNPSRYRPPRMRPLVDATYKDIVDRLKLRSSPIQQDGDD